MPEPKISRRCSSCGASARESAAFCPQCGKELRLQNPNSEKAPTAAVTAPLDDVSTDEDTSKAESMAETIADVPREVLEEEAQEDEGLAPQDHSSPQAETFLGELGSTAEPASTLPLSGQGVKPEKVAVGKVRNRIQRATSLARDVEGDVIHRVQKVREISSVVLDEAAYDPSLRFILVACVLFVLFLLIMLLNKLIG